MIAAAFTEIFPMYRLILAPLLLFPGLALAEPSIPSRASAPIAGAVEDVAVLGSGRDALLLAATGEAGLQAFATDGSALATLDVAAANLVEVLPTTGGDRRIAVLQVASGEIRFHTVEGSAERLRLRPLGTAPIRLDDEATGLCAYASPLDGTVYLFVVTDSGMVEQWALGETAGGLQGQRVRSLPLGKGAGACAVDERGRMVYVAEESMGVWRFGAEPESDPGRELAALAAPRGPLGEENKGVALRADPNGQQWLLVAEASAPRLHVLALPSMDHAGAVAIKSLGEAEGLAVGDGAGAVVAIADENETSDGTRLRLLEWQAIADALELGAAPGAQPAVTTPALVVRPDRETDEVQSFGDAADDAEIWVHPADPAQSLVITAQKKQGLHVFDLEGRTVQVLADGRMNNVDLRGDLVAATNRSDDTVTLYRVDPKTRRLARLEGQAIATGFIDPYGVCLYRSARDGALYAFASDAEDGRIRQWRLAEQRGRVRAEPVREWRMESMVEGCVADDALGRLYVGEEDTGLWRFDAEPDGATDGVLVDRVGEGRLVADVEGVSVYAGPGETGYVVVSSQGSDDYVLFARSGDNAYAGRFHIVADPVAGIDGASETDGLAVSAVPLGTRYQRGLLVVQDGRNLPRARQNFKYVPWDRVEALLPPRQD